VGTFVSSCWAHPPSHRQDAKHKNDKIVPIKPGR
jgi:hypothetical protein